MNMDLTGMRFGKLEVIGRASRHDQSRNMSSNHYIEINGVSKTITDWAEEYSVNAKSIYSRIKSGWDPDKAVTQPFKKLKSKEWSA